MIILQEGKKKMFYLTTHSMHLYLHGIRHMVKDHSYSERKPAAVTTWATVRLPVWGILYAPSHKEHSTYHRLCYIIHGALAGMRNRSMGPPRRTGLKTHGTMVNALTMELHLANDLLTSLRPALNTSTL